MSLLVPEKFKGIIDMAYRHISCSTIVRRHGWPGLFLQIDVRILFCIGGLAILVGCGERAADAPESPLLTAATLGEQSVRAASEYLAAAPYADADLANGERQAQVCRACHVFAGDGANMLGPSLYGIFGMQVGTRADFDYSAALRNVDFIWTPRALDAWLVQPGRFLPGNRMVFGGVSRASDRRDLIAYLLHVTTAKTKTEE